MASKWKGFWCPILTNVTSSKLKGMWHWEGFISGPPAAPVSEAFPAHPSQEPLRSGKLGEVD